MTKLGITSFGAYIPRLRLDRTAIAAAHKWMAPSLKGIAKGTRAFCSWDEDGVTMSVEAGRNALAGLSSAGLKNLVFASTRPTYADLQSSAIIARALDSPLELQSFDVGNSQRAGTSALLQALQGSLPTLVTAADAPLGKPASTQEIMYGAGAAAFALGTENVVAKLVSSATVTANFVDHFRGAGERYDYFWEDRWIRDEGYSKLAVQAIKAALADAGLTIADIASFAMPSLLRGGAAATAKAVKFAGKIVDDLSGTVGYAGAAHAPLMLASALEDAAPGDRVMVVGFGQGADVLIFEVTDAIKSLPAHRSVAELAGDAIVTDSYLRMLTFSEVIELDWGMRAERSAKTALTEQYRSAFQTEAFKAGKCPSCGIIQFPQLEYCVNQACLAPAKQFDQLSLVNETARVLTYTADWLTYTFSPPLYVGFAQFDNGARVSMEMVDVDEAGIDVDTKLRMVYRIKERDRVLGYNRYFWKATPVKA